MSGLNDPTGQRDTAEPCTEPTERTCAICGQPSGRAATCWTCFVAGDDAYRRAVDR